MILALIAGAAMAADIVVIDGDTFEMDGETIRLWGIDAPELDQQCNGEPVGRQAAAHLSRLFELAEGPPECTVVNTDRYGRTIARCRLDLSQSGYALAPGGGDVGWIMVADGMARDWPRFSDDMHADAEAIAIFGSHGMWAHDCIAPWEWRRR